MKRLFTVLIASLLLLVVAIGPAAVANVQAGASVAGLDAPDSGGFHAGDKDKAFDWVASEMTDGVGFHANDEPRDDVFFHDVGNDVWLPGDDVVTPRLAPQKQGVEHLDELGPAGGFHAGDKDKAFDWVASE